MRKDTLYWEVDKNALTQCDRDCSLEFRRSANDAEAFKNVIHLNDGITIVLKGEVAELTSGEMNMAMTFSYDELMRRLVEDTNYIRPEMP